ERHHRATLRHDRSDQTIRFWRCHRHCLEASARSARADSYAGHVWKRQGHPHHQRPAYHRRTLRDGASKKKAQSDREYALKRSTRDRTRIHAENLPQESIGSFFVTDRLIAKARRRSQRSEAFRSAGAAPSAGSSNVPFVFNVLRGEPEKNAGNNGNDFHAMIMVSLSENSNPQIPS